ncbi:hypothetical protein A6A05_08930 [Magnetospirillum moscoviense]|uniref:Uncharacterized protein n=1 Tax=Magnetospirillum moscoviense TaxID=1437059 RepID=A0A178MVY9_9PROT|nr:hypothetical protein A6A05_08930 [Magnetospirillum moscoviense]
MGRFLPTVDRQFVSQIDIVGDVAPYFILDTGDNIAQWFEMDCTSLIHCHHKATALFHTKARTNL